MVLSIGVCAAGGYTVARQRRRTQRSRVGEGAIGSRSLRLGRLIVGSEFGERAVGGEAARQGRQVIKVALAEAPRDCKRLLSGDAVEMA